MFSNILLVFAFALACLAAWLVASPEPKAGLGSRLGWASLAFYFLSLVLAAHW